MAERGARSAVVCLIVLGVGCSGGGSGGGPAPGFELANVSVEDGSVWPINREIVLTFTEPIDFASVSANTINVRSLADVPAIGEFFLRAPSTVVFQPSCPTRADYSDAGLELGATYLLRVAGLDGSPNTVRSLRGVPLGLQQTRTFSTRDASDAAGPFQDGHPGAPVPVVRARGSADRHATYLELGGDPDARVYFERDASGEVALARPGFAAPLNLYSEPGSRLALVLAFDQPIEPALTNLSDRHLRLEYGDGDARWQLLDTRATLLANCAGTGVLVRLEPIGPLPRACAVRAVVLPGFQDIAGETTRELVSVFPPFPTRAVDFTSLSPAELLGDEWRESFDHGGDGPLSSEDPSAVAALERAAWGAGQLSASGFGSGGPGGDFDWVVRAGETTFFDTTSTWITGGPGGAPATSVHAQDGVVEVRHLTIERGATLRVHGPNAMRVFASGEVRIAGTWNLGGFQGKDVNTLHFLNDVQPGGAGAAGGGQGGESNGNGRFDQTPRGGRGLDPSGQRRGGEGGEMGVSNDGSKNARRPGGGGGGRFARDWSDTVTASGLSMAAQAGTDGNPRSRGAQSGTFPARGGKPGDGPFLDADEGNDFFGFRPAASGGGALSDLVRGELPALWGGHGGGGGGNATRRYPNPVWSYVLDDMGGPGGGGGGGLHVKALGAIVFAEGASIRADGGAGGTGQDVFVLDHVGGTGGGGSGGHVILESATRVDFTDGGATISPLPRDFVSAAGPLRKEGSIIGIDPCSWDHLCCPDGCQVYSNGGAGGPGVIQLHVQDPTLPPASSDAPILVPGAGLPGFGLLDRVTSPPAVVLFPTESRSRARSRWLSIGAAGRRPDGSGKLVRFLFAGIDPGTGRIQASGHEVAERAPLVTVADVGRSSAARILADGLTLELSGAALDAIRDGTTAGISNDLYLRTPALLEDCLVRLRVAGRPASFADFTIARASYDEGTPAAVDETLRVTVGVERGLLTSFDPPGEATIVLDLVPRFFRVLADGIPDVLPAGAAVSVRFQAAADDGFGAPDEQRLLQDWTADLSLLERLPAGELQFFRYEVEFTLAADGAFERPRTLALDFLRVPFLF